MVLDYNRNYQNNNWSLFRTLILCILPVILLTPGGAALSGVLSVSDSINNIGTVDWTKLSETFNPNATGSNIAIWQITPLVYDSNTAPSGLKFYAKLEGASLSLLVNGSEDDSLRMMLNISQARISNGSLTPNDHITVRYNPKYTYLYFTLQSVLDDLKSNSIISPGSTLSGNDYVYKTSFTEKVFILGAWYLTTSYNAGVPAHNIPFGNGLDNCKYDPGIYTCTSANGIAEITNNFAYINPKYGYMIASTMVDNGEYTRISIDDTVWLRRDGSWGRTDGNRKWNSSFPAKVNMWSQKTWSWIDAYYWYAVAADNVSVTGSTTSCTIGTCYLNYIDVNTYIPMQKGQIEWMTDNITINNSPAIITNTGTLSLTYNLTNIGTINQTKLTMDYDASISSNYTRFEITPKLWDILQGFQSLKPGTKYYAIIDTAENTFTIRIEGNSSELLRNVLPKPVSYVYTDDCLDGSCIKWGFEVGKTKSNMINVTAFKTIEYLKTTGILSSGNLTGTPVFRTSIINSGEKIFLFGYGMNVAGASPYIPTDSWSWNVPSPASYGDHSSSFSFVTENMSYQYLVGHTGGDNGNNVVITINGSEWLRHNNWFDSDRHGRYNYSNLSGSVSLHLTWSAAWVSLWHASTGKDFLITQAPYGKNYNSSITPVKDELLKVKVSNQTSGPVASGIIDTSTLPDLSNSDVTGGNVLNNTYTAPADEYFYKLYLRPWSSSGKGVALRVDGLRSDNEKWEVIENYQTTGDFIIDNYDFFETGQKTYDKIRIYVDESEDYGTAHYEYKLWHGKYQDGSKVTAYYSGTDKVASEKITDSDGYVVFGLDPMKSYDLAVDGRIYNRTISVPNYVNITVLLPPVLTIITVPDASVAAGTTTTFTATTLDQYGAPIAATLTWSSSNTTVGSIDPDTGLFTALSAGTSTIIATSGSVVSNSATVTVLPGLASARGDVNRNSILDTGDATLILRYLVGLPTPSEYLPILPAGDMNCNDIIDTGDATLILRGIVGLDISRCWE